MEIRKLFKKSGILTELIMLSTPNQPLQKNNRVVRIYLLLFILSFIMNTIVALSIGQTFILMLIFSLVGTDLVVFFSIWRYNTSYIEKNNKISMVTLLETFDPESLCPFCQVIRLPQSRHCNICNRCIDRYDHHCPWINNCVGRTNHSRFYLHLILIVTYCVVSLLNAII